LVSSSRVESTGSSRRRRSQVTETTERPARATDPLPIDQLGFDEALAELQKTVAELEAGGQPLERSLALYERGVALHERCAKLLTEAELRLKQLVSQAGGALAAVDLATEEAREE
jgi:exodeoxyribonuclease VII small subunit